MQCPICEHILTCYVSSDYIMLEDCRLECPNCGFKLETTVPWFNDDPDDPNDMPPPTSEQEHTILCERELTKMYNDFCKNLENFK